ncbi:MAG: hypothetical protein ACJA0U_000154 [Salibacteraceae bacterium]|jgi:hypothetical protein
MNFKSQTILIGLVPITLLCFMLVGCNSTEKKNAHNSDLNVTVKDSVNFEATIINETLNIDTLKIFVVQCSNGYSGAGYDFNPFIETELNKFESVQVEPFPFKKLMGVAYQGVFDKKYCTPIIEEVDVDFLILTRVVSNAFPEVPGDTETEWGYELRIVNTKTLEQINSISAGNLKEYEQIENHIKDNIEILKSDILKLK